MGIIGRAGIDAVGHAHFLANALKQPGGTAAAENVIQHRHGIHGLAAHGRSPEGNAQVHLFGILIPAQLPRLRDGHRFRKGLPLRAGPAAELVFQQRPGLLRGHIARNGHHRILGAIMAPAEGAQILRLIGGDFVGRAQNGLPQCLLAKYCLGQHVKHHVLRRILHHGDFLQNHTPLLIRFLGIQQRIAHNVRQNIRGHRQVLVDHLGVIIGAQLAGGRVEHAANGVHFLSNLPGAAAGRALKGHMLHEMGQAVFRRRFQHGSRLHPYADGCGPQIRHGLDQHRQPV